jgi:hypothetical protein
MDTSGLPNAVIKYQQERKEEPMTPIRDISGVFRMQRPSMPKSVRA